MNNLVFLDPIFSLGGPNYSRAAVAVALFVRPDISNES